MLFALFSRLTSLGLPEGAPGKLRRGAQVFTALGSWSCGGTAALWDDWGRPVLLVLSAVAAMSAVVCWAVAISEDADRKRLTRALGDALSRVPPEELRGLLVRSAR